MQLNIRGDSGCQHRYLERKARAVRGVCGADLLCFIPDPTADKQFLTRNKLVTAMRINLEDNQGLAEKEVTKGINN